MGLTNCQACILNEHSIQLALWVEFTSSFYLLSNFGTQQIYSCILRKSRYCINFSVRNGNGLCEEANKKIIFVKGINHHNLNLP